MCSHETALPAASPFSSSKTFPETFLGVSPPRLPPPACADRPPLSCPRLSRLYLAELTDQASASLGFRLQQPPGGPSPWATSLTNFAVGREIHVQQKGGSVPQALTQFPLCLWALILKSVPDCSLSLTFFSSFCKDPSSLNHTVSSLHLFLPSP